MSRRFRAVSVSHVVLLASLMIAVCIGTPVFAQYTTASLGGSVVDQSGASVPDAKVTVHSPDTGMTKTGSTAADGSFVFRASRSGTTHSPSRRRGFRPTCRKASP